MYVEALVELGAPDAIEGVIKTCRSLTGINKKWNWMKAAKSYARGRLVEFQYLKINQNKS